GGEFAANSIHGARMRCSAKRSEVLRCAWDAPRSWRAADADRRVYALLSKKILRQDARRRWRLQGHGQARSLAAGAIRPRASQEDRRRPQGLSADPVLPAAAGGKLRQVPGAD